MKNWNEIKTAAYVARMGTVSAAAEALSVHRATVIRHIDALEQLLGQKIFLRHARGYTPTDAGRELMRVAESAEQQFNQLAGKAQLNSNALSGNLILTSMEVFSPELMPAIRRFHERYPRIEVEYIASERVFALEYGEAHIAVRVGAKPKEPDNVVQPFYKHQVGLYASSAYALSHGIPAGPEDFPKHSFVVRDRAEAKNPFEVWMNAKVPDSCIRFQSKSISVLDDAIRCGLGIGFYSRCRAEKCPDLIEVFPRKHNWEVPLWLVTHVDQHRAPKVQAFLNVLKEERDQDYSNGFQLKNTAHETNCT